MNEEWTKVAESNNAMQAAGSSYWALFGLERIVALMNSNKLWPLIMVSNKVSLQNQLQNPRASDPEECNEAFDRAIRGWLL